MSSTNYIFSKLKTKFPIGVSSVPPSLHNHQQPQKMYYFQINFDISFYHSRIHKKMLSNLTKDKKNVLPNLFLGIFCVSEIWKYCGSVSFISLFQFVNVVLHFFIWNPRYCYFIQRASIVLNFEKRYLVDDSSVFLEFSFTYKTIIVHKL